MIKKVLCFLLVIFNIGCTGNQLKQAGISSGIYEIDPSSSNITLKVSYLGIAEYTAYFPEFNASLDFNSMNPQNSKFTAKIKADSIKTNLYWLDKENIDKMLSQNEKWFNSKKFPEITFESTEIKRSGLRKAHIKGNLTMLGITRPVDFESSFIGFYENELAGNVSSLEFSAIARIKRSEWGLTEMLPSVSDDVELIIKTKFNQKK